MSLYLHVAGDYDRVLENTFGVLESPGIYFGQDSGNTGTLNRLHRILHCYCFLLGDAVTPLTGQRTCDSQVAGSILAGHHCIVALDKLLTPMCLCHQTVYLVPDKGVVSLVVKVTAGLMQSNGSLPAGLF